MNRIYFKTTIFLMVSMFFFLSCEDKLPTEFGNSNVYFSNTVQSILYRGVDAANLELLNNEQDTTYMTVSVYRSGIVNNLEEIKLTLSIDSAYLDSIISEAQTALPENLTDLMTKYKNSEALGETYFSIPSSVTIPQGERRVVMPLTINRSLVKLYKNAKFNYSFTDLTNTNIPKDKMLVLPFKILTTSSLSILQTNSRSYFQITKIGDLK